MSRRKPSGAVAGAVAAVESPPDWPLYATEFDVSLERDIAHLRERIQAEKSELRRHAMWHLLACKIRMRSDAQIRRQELRARFEAPPSVVTKSHS